MPMTNMKDALVTAAMISAGAAVHVEERSLGHFGHVAAHASQVQGEVSDLAVGDAVLNGGLATALAFMDARYAAGATVAAPLDLTSLLNGIAGNESLGTNLSVLNVEMKMGHGAWPAGHANAVAGAAGAEADANVRTIIAASLNLWVAALDARYAAGVTVAAGTEVVGLQTAIVAAAQDVAQMVVYWMERDLGHVPHSLEFAGVRAEVAATASTAWAPLFLAQLDARYQAHA